jgi:hypothetical protein
MPGRSSAQDEVWFVPSCSTRARGRPGHKALEVKMSVPATAASAAVRPFRIEIPEEDLAELHPSIVIIRRLAI